MTSSVNADGMRATSPSSHPPLAVLKIPKQSWLSKSSRLDGLTLKMVALTPLLRRSIRPSHLRSIRCLATASDARPPPSFNNKVRIVEVGPRDGLQNEKTTIPLATKIELIERLSRTGLTTIESGAFVSPKWVPQVSGDLTFAAAVNHR